MWVCQNCREEIEDKYQHCWNCGARRPEAAPKKAKTPKFHIKLSSAEKSLPAEKPPPVVESSPAEIVPPPVSKTAFDDGRLLFGVDSSAETASAENKTLSRIKTVVFFVLWLAVVGLLSIFIYRSSQKTAAFDRRISEEAARFESQKDQFIFPKNKKVEKASIEAKVLPLKVNDTGLDGLYYVLPDDLRPADAGEIKTILWLDCKSNEYGRFEDGSTAYRDLCNAYLVDKNTSQIRAVQDFLGEVPPFSKKGEAADAFGKVLPERYIALIRNNQPESERNESRSPADSPDQHIINKSEMVYAVILLVLFSAAGFGWLVFKLRRIH